MTYCRRAGLAAAIVALLAVAAGCGGYDDDETPSHSASDSAEATSGAPISTATATPTPRLQRYIVQDGDTLNAIADRFGVSVEALIAANGIDDPASLQVGQVLVIPAGGVTAAPTPTGGTIEPTSTQPGDEVTLLHLVDKQHALPNGYVPPGLASVPVEYAAPGFSASLRQEALDALIEMFDDAVAAGHDVRVRSGYRSYAEQQVTFDYWVSVLGYDEAVRVSAMPGHSEHQLGTAADLTSDVVGWDLVESFGSTPDGQWLDTHAHEYGFALSYPAGAEEITGYAYEPWHFRYIGESAAADWKAGGQPLNQFLASQ